MFQIVCNNLLMFSNKASIQLKSDVTYASQNIIIGIYFSQNIIRDNLIY